MIDIATEKLLTLDQAAERLIVSKATVLQWIKHGSNGVVLDGIKFGVHWRTSEEALQRFGDRLTPRQEEATSRQASITRRDPEWEARQARVREQLDDLFGIRKCETCRKVIERGTMVFPKGEKLWCPDCLVKRKSVTMGQRIRTFRWAAQLSMQELAARAGFGTDKLRRYESNQAEPPESHLAKLVEVLGRNMLTGIATKLGDVLSESNSSQSNGTPVEQGQLDHGANSEL